MKVYAISDLHLSFGVDKPMDVFGENWAGHFEKIKKNWLKTVTDSDTVLLGGDFSWAMGLEQVKLDFEKAQELTGKKVLIKGNHDYWWNSLSKVRKMLPKDFFVIQNDAVAFGDYIICGSRGWTVPGFSEFTKNDNKIYLREVERLKMSLSYADKIKSENQTVIAMMHFPPFNAQKNDNLFTELFEKHNIKNVIYGHLHGNKSKVDKLIVKNNVKYHLTSCDILDFELALIY